MRHGRRVVVAILVALLAPLSGAMAAERATLERAQHLAWNKQFAKAEQTYREILIDAPESREARLGLARVVLWRGRYREARAIFLALRDREGAATAAYWQGDFRTAAREFEGIPDSPFARESLSAIRQAARGNDRLDADWLHDDQPFRTLRSMVASSFFSDPLTRWDVATAWTKLSAPSLQSRRSLLSASITNETVLPWQRLTLIASAGIQQFPDDTVRPAGSIALRWRSSSTSSITAAADHRALLTNATALRTHPTVTRRTLAWNRYSDHGWIAGVEAASLRYFDHNRGRYAQAFGLVPLKRNLWIGVSGAVRDTADNRFYLEAVSGTQSGAGDSIYGYRGSYTPYWTPKHLREARALVLITAELGRFAIKTQLESGIAHDTVTGFGPERGNAPLPVGIFSFDFRRTSHPARAAITLGTPITTRYRLDCTIERNTTAFYAANSIHASLVRQR